MMKKNTLVPNLYVLSALLITIVHIIDAIVFVPWEEFPWVAVSTLDGLKDNAKKNSGLYRAVQITKWIGLILHYVCLFMIISKKN